MSKNRILLNQTEISDFLQQNFNWSLKNNGIERKLKFHNYMDGIEFINKLATKAEEINHHPNLTVGWCVIHVRFSTHDLGGLSTFDIIMANNIAVSGFTFDITGINIASVNGGLLYNNQYEIKYTSLELEWDDTGLGYHSAKGFQAYSLKGTEIQPSNDILTTITYSGIPNKVCINAKIVDSDAMPINTKNPECIDLNK